MKGQMTFVNLIAVFITLIIFFVMAPVLDTIIETTITALEQNPNEYTPLIAIACRLSIFIILLSIILTALNYAVPHREAPPRGYG